MRTTSSTPFDAQLDALAHRITRTGVTECEAELAEVAKRARAAGLVPIAVSVLTDHTEPPVIRERAFVRVGSALAGVRRRRRAAVTAQPTR